MSNRAETGPMKFGDDWPGVFIRGDNALHFASGLEKVLDWIDKQPDGPGLDMLSVVQGLRDTLVGPDIRNVDPVSTRLLAFDDCLAKLCQADLVEDGKALRLRASCKECRRPFDMTIQIKDLDFDSSFLLACGGICHGFAEIPAKVLSDAAG